MREGRLIFTYELTERSLTLSLGFPIHGLSHENALCSTTPDDSVYWSSLMNKARSCLWRDQIPVTVSLCTLLSNGSHVRSPGISNRNYQTFSGRQDHHILHIGLCRPIPPLNSNAATEADTLYDTLATRSEYALEAEQQFTARSVRALHSTSS